MTSEYLVSALLDSMRDTGMLPTSDESFTTARLLAVMNAEQRLFLSRLLLSAREEYQVAHSDVALVAGQARYPIPPRAVGAKLKLVAVVDAGGHATPLQPATPERFATYGAPGAGYYLERNSIVLTATALTGTLRLSYFRRLGRLVDAAEVAVITNIDAGTGIISWNAKPTAYAIGATSQRFDFVQANPHFDVLAADVAGTVASADFAVATVPDGLAVGDYVCLAGETPVCQAPVELHGVLVQRAVVKVLEAKGDPKAQSAAIDLERMRLDALALITPRVEATPMAVVNAYAPGWGRYPRNRRFR